jgi:excisionase family DNA binding protein
MSDTQDQQLLIIPQACDFLKLSTATLARMRRDKEGPPFVKMGTRVLYRKSDLDAYIKSNLSH